MSIEYTIDIQLTELGFPDILSPPDSAAHCKPLNHTHDPASEPAHPPPLPGQGSSGVAQEEAEEYDEDLDDSAVSDDYDEEESEEKEEEEEEGEGDDEEAGHSGDFHCSVCDLQLPTQLKLQNHMNLHTGARPYLCAECGKRFSQIHSYRLHLRKHAQIKQVRLQCRVCLKFFTSQKNLNRHFSETHFEKEFYECDLCKRVFTSRKACEYHVEMHRRGVIVKCEVCNRDFSSRRSLAHHQKRKCFTRFRCTDCSKTFSRKISLLKHSFSHLGLLPYTCVRCHCHFRMVKLYRQHKCEPQRIHCVACLREFLGQQDFEQHKKDTGCWGNQEPKGDEIRCLECGQEFDSLEELKKHAGAHQRVLRCADCGKGFRSALLLMSHMGGHAGNSPCLCQSCGLGFPHQQSYDSHLKTCGQTDLPLRAPKKRPASKKSRPEPKKLRPTAAKDDPPPAPALPLVMEATSDPTNTLWKLTLDKQPPPGVNLVLFVPVCQTETDVVALQPVVSPTLVGPGLQIQPETNAAEPPLNLETRINQDAGCEAPLDLSKKCDSSKCSPPPLKSEPEEFEVMQNGKVICDPHLTDTSSEEKKNKTDPIDVSSQLRVDIKEEPLS